MDTLTAFYLVGHGPRREPRFIELQHMRVVRYRYLANHPSDPFAAPEIYVDLNQERLPPSSILATSFPQLATLISAIEANKIKLVYLDLFEGEAPGPDFSWIPRLLKDAGAEVVNVFYDELGSLQGLIDVRYGGNATSSDVTDASDFNCFFPRSGSEIAAEALGGTIQLHTHACSCINTLVGKLNRLSDLSPYRGGRLPLFSVSLETNWIAENSTVNESPSKTTTK